MPNLVLKKYIEDIFLKKHNTQIELNEETELLESQILESLDIVKLVLFIQDEFRIQISFSNIEMKNFKSLKEISKLIPEVKK